jgi:hypothetical protein
MHHLLYGSYSSHMRGYLSLKAEKNSLEEAFGEGYWKEKECYQ